MPTNFRIQIAKTLPEYHWSNEYLCTEETVEDAQDVANELLTFERHIHMAAVQFAYIRVSTTLVGDRFFRHLAVNLPGLGFTVEYLPLYCTARMDMPTADSDPCRKYYRLPVAESDQQNGIMAAARVTDLNNLIATYLVTPGVLAHIFTPRGNPVISASFSNIVQMRQQHRHKKKKVIV